MTTPKPRQVREPAGQEEGEVAGLPAAFYRRIDDDTYEATSATESPWDATAQHGGPATALLIAAVERELSGSGLRATSVTAEFLGAIPRGVVDVTVSVVRSGRRVQLMEATMHATDTPVAIARCWCIRVDEREPRPATQLRPRSPHGIAASTTFLPGVSSTWPYGRAIEWRFIDGSYTETGPASVWARTRLPLIEGEPTSGLQRLAIVADSANGVSCELDPRDWLFVPTGIAITVARHQHGEWLHLDAHTLLAGDGIGTVHADLSDELGPVGTCSQPLLVQLRPT
ncbi:MAG: thioesterase family protein [Ilumatobacteraceae bacterium]